MDGDLDRLWSAVADVSRGLRQASLLAGSGCDGGESHTIPTLVIALSGMVRIEHGRRPLDLAAGQAALIAPGTRHRHAPLKPGCSAFSQGFMLGLADVELTTADQAWRLTLPEHPARELLDAACLPDCDQASRLDLVRTAMTTFANAGSTRLTPMPAAVERMWQHLRRRRLSPIGAAEVLRASGLGATRAHLLFTAYFKLTPHRLLMRHRIELACHLLLRGESVGAAAMAAGFRSRRHFTTAFRTALGTSPRRWRTAAGSPTAELS